MKTVAGLWSNHGKAVVVMLSDKGEAKDEFKQIAAKVRDFFLRLESKLI